MTRLLPTFRVKVEQLMARMEERGFFPVLFDALRTREEALRNAKRGTGSADSMHCYGVAADIICGERGWKHPEFFVALGEEAEKLLLVWGGRWKRRDMPHVQAITVSEQRTVRSLRTPEAVEAYLRSRARL